MGRRSIEDLLNEDPTRCLYGSHRDMCRNKVTTPPAEKGFRFCDYHLAKAQNHIRLPKGFTPDPRVKPVPIKNVSRKIYDRQFNA